MVELFSLRRDSMFFEVKFVEKLFELKPPLELLLSTIAVALIASESLNILLIDIPYGSSGRFGAPKTYPVLDLRCLEISDYYILSHYSCCIRSFSIVSNSYCLIFAYVIFSFNTLLSIELCSWGLVNYLDDWEFDCLGALILTP